jgi:ABC-type antimicrobial peptide transport system permease subunit
VGVPAGIGLGRYVALQLYGIQTHDPFIAGSTILLLTVISAAAGLIPAQRAGRVDPMLALRTE